MAGQTEKVSHDHDESDEAGSEDEPSDESSPKNLDEERISQSHNRLLDRLRDRKSSEIYLQDGIDLDYTKKGKDNLNLLHQICTLNFHRSLFGKVCQFVDQLLDSEDNHHLLSGMDDFGTTPLSFAVNNGKWKILKCYLNHRGSLKAASLPVFVKGNLLHRMVDVCLRRLWKPPGSDKPDENLWKCIDRLVSASMEPLMKAQDNLGNTPLHLAVAYTPYANQDAQKKLISKLITGYPKSMDEFNNAGDSPYRYRIQTLVRAKVNPKDIRDDEIAFDLKDFYMHYPDREEAAKCLYGGCEELAMELDLSEHSHTCYPFPDSSRTALEKHLKFDTILRYVDFPRITADQASAEVESKNQGKLSRADLDGMGRKDFEAIFGWLRKCGVKKIIHVRVQDTPEPSHSDETIETALENFKVEIWDWVKIDICSNTILKVTPDVTEVYLYCSGNNVVLQAWSGCDGLRNLKKLKIVNIVIYQRLESRQRTERNLRIFEERLQSQIDGIRIIPKIKRWHEHQANLANSPEGSPEQTHMWLTEMNCFVNFVQNLTVNSSPKPIKVALIDDGVDGAHKAFSDNIKNGTSFCSRQDSHNHVYSYCAPSGCHGTQMASLICQVCPEVELYVARIQDMEEGGTRQIDVESVIKAIYWAIARGVDVISMSWTFQRTTDNTSILDGALSEAIRTAASKDILMFCSTGDNGKFGDHAIYPAVIPGVFKIGAAKPSGDECEWTEPSSSFTLPGEDIRAEIPSYIESKTNSPVSGSSLATALASGLAALILHCIEIIDNNQLRKTARNHNGMNRALRHMAGQNDNRYIRAWEHLKPTFQSLSNEDGLEELKHTMQKLFE